MKPGDPAKTILRLIIVNCGYKYIAWRLKCNILINKKYFILEKWFMKLQFCSYLSTVLLLLTVSCSDKVVNNSKEKSTELSENKKSSQNRLVFSTSLWSQPSQRQYIRKHIVEDFIKETEIPVKFEFNDGEVALKRAYLQKEVGKVNMDVVTVHSGKMPIWINNGFVQDLTPYIKNWTDIHFFPLFNKSAKRNGKTFFMPIVSDVYILIANKKALKYLPAGARVNKLTWDQFVQWSHNMRKGEGVGRTVLSAVPFNSFIYQFGAIELSYGAAFPEIDSPGAMKAWYLLLEMRKDYVPNVLNVAKPTDAIQRGYAWLTFAHIADVGEVYNSDPEKYIIAPVPEGPEGRGSIGAGYGLGISSGSERRKDALKLIRYLISPKQQVKIAQGSGGFIPPVKEAIKYLGASPKDKIIKVGLEVFKKAILSGVPSNQYYDWNGVKIIFETLFKDMIIQKGEIDKEMLDYAKKQLKQVKRKKQLTPKHI